METKELKDLMNACSSVKHETRLPNGKSVIVFKERAILNRMGQPIAIDEFEQQVGHRVYINSQPKEAITPEEKKAIKNARKEWKKYHKGYKTSSLKLVPGNKFQKDFILKTLNLN